MRLSQPLPLVRASLETLDEQLRTYRSGPRGLSRRQRQWVGLCLMGMRITASWCWARCARFRAGRDSAWALTWLFRYATVPWRWRLRVRVTVVLHRDGIRQGVLSLDDVPNPRAKVTDRPGQSRYVC